MPLHLNRHSLARHLAEQVDGLTIPLASATIEVMLEAIASTVAAGGTVRLAGFGTFSLRYRQARQTRHPRSQVWVTIPAVYRPHFTPAPNWQAQVPPPSPPAL
ncbi:MAG: HU family DNA-binding protein [Cyanobacteriota bacterium]|nr:HU family DNA-binding protein [Cyanobacteriota bacterium]